jgi:c-di-GMP-binding flagellar brake protein YcgR
MSWRTRLGAAQRRGLLIHGPQDTLRLHPDGAALKVQRRQFVRVPADLHTAVIAADRRLVTRTLDVSVGGMLVAPADSLVLEEQVRFALDLGDLTISGDGLVVRGTTDGARAVRFGELQGGAERALSRFIAQRQRQLIAR